nr:hypothetical protein [Streptococcus gallolyticus]
MGIISETEDLIFENLLLFEHELEHLLHLTENDYPIATMSFGVKNK